jgi:hypothetical protein
VLRANDPLKTTARDMSAARFLIKRKYPDVDAVVMQRRASLVDLTTYQAPADFFVNHLQSAVSLANGLTHVQNLIQRVSKRLKTPRRAKLLLKEAIRLEAVNAQPSPLTVAVFSVTFVISLNRMSGQQDRFRRVSCNSNIVSAPHQYWRTTDDVHQR